MVDIAGLVPMVDVCIKIPGAKSISHFEFPARCTVGYAISYLESKLRRALALRRQSKVLGADSYSKLNENIKVLRDRVWNIEYIRSRPMLMVHAPGSLCSRCGLGWRRLKDGHSELDLTTFVIMHILRLVAYQSASSLGVLKRHLVDITVSWGTSPYVRGPGGLEFKWSKRSIETMQYWNWYIGGLIGVWDKDITMDIAIKNIESYIERMVS